MEPSPHYISSVFELLAGYIAGRFYNTFYGMAQASVSKGAASSITAAYSLILTEYEKSITSPQVFATEVQTLHNFIKGKARGFNVSFSAFQARILGCFVPPQYLHCMIESEKDTIFNDVVGGAIKSTCSYIRSNRALRLIIDDRQNGAIHCRELQNHIVSLLKKDRDSLYRKFIAAEKPKEDPKVEINRIKAELGGEILRRNAIISELSSRLDALTRGKSVDAERIGKLEIALEESRQALSDARGAENGQAAREITNLRAENTRNTEAAAREIANLRAENARNAEAAAIEIANLRAENNRLADELSRAAIPIEGRPEEVEIIRAPKKSLEYLVDAFNDELSESSSDESDFTPEQLAEKQKAARLW